jgi:cysteine desulfuration protein SufE
MSTTTEIDDIVDTFELLGDWDQRYEYLVELGERLPPMDAADKTDANRVMECMSTVHVVPKPIDGSPRLLRFHGDCDTAIIKGVVALLVGLFSGKTRRRSRPPTWTPCSRGCSWKST